MLYINNLQIKPGYSLIPRTDPQFHNINWKQPCNACIIHKLIFGKKINK